MPTNNANVGITYIDANTPPLTPSDDEVYFCKQSESIWVGDTQHSIGPLEHDISTYSFDDGIDSYFKKVVSTIVPVQAGSGTPSPTNVRAISGFTECTVLNRGINQWDEITESGVLNPQTGNKIASPGQIRSKNYIKIKPNAYYYTKSPNGIWCIFYDENHNLVTSDLPSAQSISYYGRQLQNMSWKAPATAHYMLFTSFLLMVIHITMM